ncbi:MAG: sigma-54-dependent Fis family transcriptional regulator [Deltaproteobacteria bacterium]|nr:sigma-54-dependent Fis family transcriptional regulator [Deltaproteobacteria bacterium]MBI3390629.1 sigma-54-dependent Fis family transcriptional regulator [Deltaproteobacteria bacterium]
MSNRVLIVDDEPSMCETLEAGLTPKGFEVTWTTSAAEALERIAAGEFDVVLTDLNMRGMNGIELCERVAANRPDVPVIVITAFGSLDTAVAAIRAGAYDFITKPVRIDALALALERAIQHRTLREEVKRLRQLVSDSHRFEGVLGASPAMRAVHELLERIADSDTSILITGESGTGKEVVAQALHRRSRRSQGPFIAINCAAMPEPLLESELFGHARGAFTDARTARTGLLVQASGGTLLLDEIGDMPIALQPKLLRALQERMVRPVGGDQEVPFDVRVIATTNRDLESAIEEGRFREDLFFRINVIHIAMPPLRARGSDVLLLAQHFLVHFATQSGKRVTGLSPAAAERLMTYAWPGNVRELRNCMERAVALTQYEQIIVDDLPEKIRAYRGSYVVVASDDPSELVPLEEVERRYIMRAMEALGGNKTLVAQKLGIARKTLYRKLEQYGVSGPDDE